MSTRNMPHWLDQYGNAEAFAWMTLTLITLTPRDLELDDPNLAKNVETATG